jgi:heme exporter protein B
MMRAIYALFRRDVMLAIRMGGGPSLGLGFYLIAGTLAAIGLGPEPNLLARAAPGLIWVLALLACLLSLDRLFQADFEDGALDLLVAAPSSLSALVLAKIAAHWVTTGLPLILGTPALALLFNLPFDALVMEMITLGIGTPALSLIGAIGAALTIGVRRGGLLLSLLVLPLYVPVLIFGVAAVDASASGMATGAHLSLLAASSLIALVLAPIASAAALKLHLS